MTCWGYLYADGHMTPLEGVQAGVAVTPSRSSRAFVPVSGLPRYQRSPVAPREWQLSFSPWVDPGIVSLLQAFASGGIRTRPRFYTRDAAAINLLSVSAADPLRRDFPGFGGMYASLTLADGPHEIGAWLRTGSTGPILDTVPVHAGVYYTLSATLSEGAAIGDMYEIRIYGPSGLLETIKLANPSVDPAIVVRSRTFTTPSAATHLTIAQTGSGGGQVSGARLVEGVSDGFWRAGQGVPFVEIDDPTGVLNSTADNLVRMTHAVTIREAAA